MTVADTPLIQIEKTPNPEAIRILPGVPLARGAAMELHAGDETTDVPIAATLLAIEGISSVLIGSDFVTAVRASPDSSWSTLKPLLLLAVADLLLAGKPLLRQQGETSVLANFEGDQIAMHIQEVIDRFIRPLLARDGGEATLMEYDGETGVAHVRMGGACGGCPSGKITLKHSIEQVIKRYVPEVTAVKSTEPEGQLHSDPKARFRAWIAARM